MTKDMQPGAVVRRHKTYQDSPAWLYACKTGEISPNSPLTVVKNYMGVLRFKEISCGFDHNCFVLISRPKPKPLTDWL